MRLTIVAGARPNFVKIAALVHELDKRKASGTNISYRLVHTGQHYDNSLNDIFFAELKIPNPDINLEVGSCSQAQQVGRIMARFEEELINNPCDLVIVVGDVNSTLACAIAAKKLKIPVAHIEAGIRSFDMTMPEEVNRVVTDSIADYFFTTTTVAGENLLQSGTDTSRIFFVGNIMIDTLLNNEQHFRKPGFFDQYKLKEKNYLVLTMHRPSNVDESGRFSQIMETILNNIGDHKLIFPVHPRTRRIFSQLGAVDKNLFPVDPVGYLEFNYLVKNSKAVITDSGGIQEETTVMDIPCITLRSNTERPETVTIGSNILVGHDTALLKTGLNNLFNNNWKKSTRPELWDGKAAERIVDVLLKVVIK
jgi:UDP-N-acetylglucosamine 2-epimerase (non-hydrolysing)